MRELMEGYKGEDLALSSIKEEVSLPEVLT